MIDVDYNEYKETLAENMKLIKENHDLKERLGIYESDSDTVIMSKEKWEETKQETERLKNMIKAEEKISNLLPDETDFIIVRREDYNRLFGSDKE